MPQLNILSWNIFMLPARSLIRTGQLERAKYIAEILSQKSYDVIIFQEAFHTKARQILWDGLKKQYPYQVGPANPSKIININSGVWIISKWRLKMLRTIVFSARSGIDSFAQKGALMVEMIKNKQTFQLIGTHLQAEFGHWKEKIRYHQCREIRRYLIAPFQKENVPLFLCGDFNTSNKFLVNYSLILQILGVKNGQLSAKGKQHTCPSNDYVKPNCYPNLVLDYIFYRSNKWKAKKIIRTVRSFQHAWKNNTRQDLSDHYAVEAKIRWKNK